MDRNLNAYFLKHPQNDGREVTPGLPGSCEAEIMYIELVQMYIMNLIKSTLVTFCHVSAVKP